MKFTFNGNTYKITFQYDKDYQVERFYEKTGDATAYTTICDEVLKHISTTCFIYLLQDNGNKQLIGSGVSKCQTEHDNFCKETGRKLALTRVLDILQYRFSRSESREFRTLAWKSYFARKESK